ncbi:hypothetical protein BAUCODRAFT_29856 [Baudoinia panamericana UAMH 10762]|uniref:Uncharacterized protein n=1 Tax=Baudoinia panamericana (strain UAMH 10762) TaxID=717646 RepID=M2MRR9_BAUPA|nr:uncharacterized protein BAUCODRAFT_29856 [Baudoinia panamericana UAMH 10762]EMC99511.1 hypothetical protein BAUCODRAFT_29856 [Baudoinia panamericana UAMH 10762]
MKLSTLLALPAALTTTLLTHALSTPSTPPESYTENLHLLPLPSGYLYAGFNFTASTALSAYTSQHFRYFPRSLGQILQYSRTEELHLRFAWGRWDEGSWGSRPRGGRREGGTGVEIWAWLDAGGDGGGGQDGDGGGGGLEERWSALVNSLSGLFCASLNFVDGTKTTRPVLTFEAEGSLGAGRGGRNGSLQLLHGMLPNEVVCTENLTPFLKLLPCKGKAGISSLLDGHKVFDANWQSMSIDVRTVCDSKHEGEGEAGDCRIEIEQTVDMVMDIERSMRPRDDPIPRPRPIEEIVCDESKHYHGHDTCYPQRREGEMAWSLSKIFGSPVRGGCHLAADDGGEEQAYDISLEVPSDRTVDLSIGGRQVASPNANVRRFELPEQGTFDLSLPQESISAQSPLTPPPLFASRQLTGHGQERGGMHTILRNPHPYPQRIVYLESLPWFLRPYMHTLQIAGGGASIEKMYYTPALDRKRGTHLELLLTLPADSTVELRYDVEKASLRYTEYPPDANRGFDVAPAVIRILSSSPSEQQRQQQQQQQEMEGQDSSYYLRTTSLLLPLPTPDFSMPYNVIILTSTVIALGFGSIFNFLVRRFALPEEVPPAPVVVLARRVGERIRGIIGAVRRGGGVGRDGDGSRSSGKEGEVLMDGKGKGLNGGHLANGDTRVWEGKKDR